ncbi:hypothetical protein [Lysinibacillus sp. NPDC086135]|uniref:hypothetical protein n=1 Tax=Lysinibacillus sp. NPDC086135 TaxID=3364130 RepID=UPI0037FC7915
MKCNVKDCYWNMWHPKYALFKDENLKVCVSENMDEHFDDKKEFVLKPNTEDCKGYLSYKEFCGTEK